MLMLRPLHIPRVLSAISAAILAGFLAFCAAAPALARAESAGSARGKTAQSQALSLFKESQELQKAGNPRGALAKLDEAYQLLPTPTLLFPIAKLNLELEQPIESLDTLRRYRQEMEPAEMEPGQQLGDVDKLEEKARAQLAYLRITAAVGSKVVVDGKEVGAAPLPDRVPVNPGSHKVASSGGKSSAESSVDAKAGQEVAVSLESSGRRGYFPSTLPWVFVGITTAAVLATTVVGGIALSDSSYLSGQCVDRICVGGTGTDIVALNSAVAAQRSHSSIAIGLLGATGILAVTTSVLLIIDWKRQREGRTLLSERRGGPRLSQVVPRVNLDLGLTGDGAGLSLGGRF